MSEDRDREAAERLALESRRDSISCVQLRDHIAQALAAAREEGAKQTDTDVIAATGYKIGHYEGMRQGRREGLECGAKALDALADATRDAAKAAEEPGKVDMPAAVHLHAIAGHYKIGAAKIRSIATEGEGWG